MIHALRLTALVAAFTTLAACAVHPGSVKETSLPANAIAISVGPCFGFCPVYIVSVTAKGSVEFEGVWNTVQLGRQTREAGPAGYAKVSQALTGYRPQTGSTSQTRCDARISDQQNFQIS